MKARIKVIPVTLISAYPFLSDAERVALVVAAVAVAIALILVLRAVVDSDARTRRVSILLTALRPAAPPTGQQQTDDHQGGPTA